MNWEKLVQCFNKLTPPPLRSPKLPFGKSYKEVVEYLIAYQKVKIRYNIIVIIIGVFGLLWSLLWFYCLYIDFQEKALTRIEMFPAAIWSIFVTAFNSIELEWRKKKIFELLQDRFKEGDWEDAQNLLNEMKEFTWEHFKNDYQ